MEKDKDGSMRLIADLKAIGESSKDHAL